VETAGLEPALPRCKRGVLPVELRPRDPAVRTGGVEPPQRCGSGFTGRGAHPCSASAWSDRPDSNRHRGDHDPGCLPLHHSHIWPGQAGTTGLEPAASRSTTERSARLSYAPEERGWDSNPRSRAHEAREDSHSSTARRGSFKQVWPAGVEPAISGARSRWGVRLPYDQKKLRYPRRDSNPQLPG
jgi:hypothetical protein